VKKIPQEAITAAKPRTNPTNSHRRAILGPIQPPEYSFCICEFVTEFILNIQEIQIINIKKKKKYITKSKAKLT
jgi:hypothetical protein